MMNPSNLRDTIERKLKDGLAAEHLTLVDESWKHAGHAGAALGGGHFILTVVSPQFEGINLLDRNRLVYGLLKNEMGGAIHALAIRAISPSEWHSGRR